MVIYRLFDVTEGEIKDCKYCQDYIAFCHLNGVACDFAETRIIHFVLCLEREHAMEQPKMYRSKPRVKLAMQWTGANASPLIDWTSGAFTPSPRVHGMVARLYVKANDSWLPLDIGEWIVEDENGFYPIKDSTFKSTYEEAPL